MTTILQVLFSPRPHAWSRRFAGEVVSAIPAWYPGSQLVTRDLAADPPQHPDRALYDAILSPTPDDDPRFALSERYIAEIEAADLIVIGTPVNNFTVPSTLKAWIDHIVRIHRTFRSTQAGKPGLLRDRPVIVCQRARRIRHDPTEATGFFGAISASDL
jgi:FMN-dependent NADH-azoreductase